MKTWQKCPKMVLKRAEGVLKDKCGKSLISVWYIFWPGVCVMISNAPHLNTPLQGIQAHSHVCSLRSTPHAKITFHDVLNICDGYTDCHLWGCLNMITITPPPLQAAFSLCSKQHFCFPVSFFRSVPATFSLFHYSIFFRKFSSIFFSTAIILPYQGDEGWNIFRLSGNG